MELREEAFEGHLVGRELGVPLVGVEELGVDQRQQLLRLRLGGDALDDVRRADGERELEARELAEAALVAQEGVELLVVDVPAVAALVRVVAAVVADAVLVGDGARAARALQLLAARAVRLVG